MENDKRDPVKTQPRRAYVAPRVEESAPFEHLILSCVRSSFSDECGSPGNPSGVHS